MTVERASPAAVRMAPHIAQQLFAREYARRLTGEHAQQLVLLARELEPVLLDLHDPCGEVDRQPADAEHPLTPAAMRTAISARDLGALLARVEHGITHPSDWPAREGTAEDDVTLWWTHVVSLHRKSRTLHKELKDAELALGDTPSEENLAWLRDVQERLAALDGAEALIDGFGGASGRPVRNF